MGRRLKTYILYPSIETLAQGSTRDTIHSDIFLEAKKTSQDLFFLPFFFKWKRLTKFAMEILGYTNLSVTVCLREGRLYVFTKLSFP